MPLLSCPLTPAAAEGRLYAGTANPHNLWADASARISGGWEVWQVAGEGQTQAAITSV